MKCPTCGEELPVLSKVCPYCKTVVDKGDGAPDAMELARALDAEIIEIKKLVPESGQVKLGANVWLYILIAGVFLGLLALKTGAGLLWILTLSAVVVSIVVYRRTRKVTVAAKLADAKIAYEYGVTLVKRYFKGNSEMSRFVDENQDIVNKAEAGIQNGRKRNLLIGLGVAIAEAILCGVILAAVPSKDAAAQKKVEQSQKMPADYDGQVAWYIKAGQPEKAVEVYADSEYNEEYVGAPKRVALCQALCQAGFTAQAEDFVLRYCMGKMQDLDCAQEVVRAHLAASNPEAAATFAAKCTGLKYKSDISKLKELI